MYFLWICMTLLTLAQARTFGISAPCFEESQCPDDYYCETSASFCRQCLQCKDFRREAPSNTVPCVTAVAKCGPCLTGYVDKVECVPPDAWWEHLILPYNWLVSSFVLLALIVCVAIVCVLRKLRVYTLRATVSTTKQSASDLSMAETEPAPPPPYNSVTCLPPPDLQILNRDARIPQIRPVLNKVDACESIENQTATLCNPPQIPRMATSTVWNPPRYEDGEDSTPRRYESAMREVSNQLEDQHNEELNNMSSNSVNTSVEATDPDSPISTSLLRVRQDSTNKDSGDASGRNSGGRAVFNNQNYSPLIINVIKNDNILQQNNEISI